MRKIDVLMVNLTECINKTHNMRASIVSWFSNRGSWMVLHNGISLFCLPSVHSDTSNTMYSSTGFPLIALSFPASNNEGNCKQNTSIITNTVSHDHSKKSSIRNTQNNNAYTYIILHSICHKHIENILLVWTPSRVCHQVRNVIGDRGLQVVGDTCKKLRRHRME
jgi:hypothetical protein